jgi:VWFA-related protein
VASKLVVVDVFVTDSHGAPVLDLPRAAFTVLEDGKPQRIRGFDEHDGTKDAPAAAPVRMPDLGPDVFTNYTAAPPSGVLTVVLLDMLNTPFREQSVVRDQLLKYLDGMHPGDRIAIFGLSDQLFLLQGFASDPAILKKALLASKKGQLTRLMDDAAGGGPAPGITSDPTQYGNDPGVNQIIANLAEFESSTESMRAQLRVEETLDALNLLGRYLSNLKGRKNILWFSSNFPSSVLLDANGLESAASAPDLEQKLRQTTNLLAASESALYPIDAKGLFTSPSFSANVSRSAKGAGLSQSIANEFQQTASDHNAMEQLAADTGGKAFYNTNGLKEAAAAAVEAGSTFYTLAYSPANKASDGAFRTISVKVEGKSYQLNYRRGYFADTDSAPAGATAAAAPGAPALNGITSSDAVPSAAAPQASAVSAALMRGAPNPTEILFKVRALPGAGDQQAVFAGNQPAADIKGPWRVYAIDLSADIRNVALVPLTNGMRQMRMEYVVLVYSQNGALVNSTSGSFANDLTDAGYARTLRQGMQIHTHISVPQTGKYVLRIGVHDQTGDRLGTVEIPVDQLHELPAESVAKPAAASATAGPATPKP